MLAFAGDILYTLIVFLEIILTVFVLLRLLGLCFYYEFVPGSLFHNGLEISRWLICCWYLYPLVCISIFLLSKTFKNLFLYKAAYKSHLSRTKSGIRRRNLPEIPFVLSILLVSRIFLQNRTHYINLKHT